jgi:SAM-dependent methyltransferase
MKNFELLEAVRQHYMEGGNILSFLKSQEGRSSNEAADILMSYDFQAGTYTAAYDQNPALRNDYGAAIARELERLPLPVSTILDVGTGEGITLIPALNALGHSFERVLACDISWSRLRFAKDFAARFPEVHVTWFVANLFRIPLANCAVDVVLTAHALEPNGGHEEAALRELIRVCRKYLVLMEPGFEWANEEARARMTHHGYVKGLRETAEKLGCKVLTHAPFSMSLNPLNPSGLLVLEVPETSNEASGWICPITGELLRALTPGFLSSSLVSYPVLQDIPCLLPEQAILSTALPKF